MSPGRPLVGSASVTELERFPGRLWQVPCCHCLILANTLYLECFTRSLPQAVVVRVKARAVDNKRWQRLDPAGGRWGIFGLHTVPASAKEVVITEVMQ